jgi:hypothetical protein
VQVLNSTKGLKVSRARKRRSSVAKDKAGIRKSVGATSSCSRRNLDDKRGVPLRCQ